MIVDMDKWSKEEIMGVKKRKALGGSVSGTKGGKSDDGGESEPPYKVLFPGQRRFSSNSRYALREFMDPRLPYKPPTVDPMFDLSDAHEEELCKGRATAALLEYGSPYEASDSEDDDIIITNQDNLPPLEIIEVNDDDWMDHFNFPTPAQMAKAFQKRERKEIRQRTPEARLKMLKKQDSQCAEAALQFYNEKHGTDYEIVETRGSYSTLAIGFWFHCNFRAQSKSATHHHGRHSSPKLFFAELYQVEADTLVVNHCKMLDGPGHSSHMVRGCKMCGNELWHPINGFKVGK